MPVRAEEDAGLWIEAEDLMNQQSALRGKLESIMRHNPKCGIYDDEQDEHEGEEVFVNFVVYIQQWLSRSSRTILRAALDHTSAPRSDEWARIMELIFSKSASKRTFHEAGKRMNKISPGRCFRRLVHAETSLENLDIEKIIEKKQPEDEEAFRRVAKSSLDVKRQRLMTKVLQLKNDIETDAEYQRYCELQRLWKGCGASILWDNFLFMDLFICRQRGSRGKSFERKSANLLFRMIALRLERFDLTYQANVYWWNGRKQVGEVDLVILDENERVVAVCELKSSYVEISAAMSQHESKLLNGNCRVGPTWNVAYDWESPPLFFVATMLPSSGHTLGVDPALANAACEGIRAQGYSFADTSEQTCAPFAEFLEVTPPSQSNTEIALARIDALPINLDCKTAPVDYPELKDFVMNKVGPAHVKMSPHSCIRHHENQILVLPEKSKRLSPEQKDIKSEY